MRIELKDGKKVDVIVRQDGEIYKYFIDDGKTEIGVFDPKTMVDNIMFKENTIANELSAQIKDAINKLDQNEIKDEANQTKALDTYARETGERNYKIRTVDLKEEKRKNKDEVKDKENKENKENEEIDNAEENKKTTTKDINVKQEIDIFERATDIKDLKGWFGEKIPSDIKKIAIIYSDDMSKMKDDKGKSYSRDTTRYSLATINNKNEIEPLSKYIPLQQRNAAGSNPMKGKNQIRNNGIVDQDDAVLSEYQIGNKVIQIDNKEMGEVKMLIGKEAHGSTEVATTEVRDSNDIYVSSTKSRKAINGEYNKGMYGVNDSLSELEEHKKCEHINTDREIDGDSSTKSLFHKDTDYDSLAKKWGFYKINGEPDIEKAKQIYERAAEDNPEMSEEELIEAKTEEFENDYRGDNNRIK